MVPMSVPSDTFAPKVCFAPATPLFGSMPPKLPLQRLALLLLPPSQYRSGVYFRFSYFRCRTQAGHKSAHTSRHEWTMAQIESSALGIRATAIDPGDNGPVDFQALELRSPDVDEGEGPRAAGNFPGHRYREGRVLKDHDSTFSVFCVVYIRA